MTHRRPTPRSPLLIGACAVALAAASLPGCSLFVMGGKMLFGDPINPPVFTEATDVDLTEGEHAVLVLASSPESVKARFPEVDQEIMRRVGRLLRAEEVDVIRSDDVLDWIEERGGTWNEYQIAAVAEEFGADYVVTVEVDYFTWQEPHSPDLLRGRSGGTIEAYAAEPPSEFNGDAPGAGQVFSGGYESVYPPHSPKTAGSVTEKLFREQFLDRLCTQASQQFLPHRPRDTIY